MEFLGKKEASIGNKKRKAELCLYGWGEEDQKAYFSAKHKDGIDCS